MVLVQIFLAYVYSHFLEYFLHRWFLHTRVSKTWFKYHWGLHHKKARQNQMIDSKYDGLKNLYKDDEVIGLSVLAVIHLPLYFIFPFAYFALVYAAIEYYVLHRLAHSYEGWGRKHLSWHYDHHMGPNQNLNWGVRLPLIDRMVGTRSIYKNTEREKRLKFKTKRRRVRD